jgi:hypothetical protein
MSDKLGAAVEALEEDLIQQEAEVADTKRMINSLRRRMGLDPLYDEAVRASSSIRADHFYGKPLATAAREYLEMRKNKGAVDSAEILEGLRSGGFDFKATGWKDEKDYNRMLAISLAKNNVVFHKLPNGKFGLLSWYDGASLRKGDKVKASQAASSEDSEE